MGLRLKTKLFVEGHLPLLAFSLFVILSFVALLLFQARALRELKLRNEKILSHYEQILSTQSATNNDVDIDIGTYSKEFGLSLAQILALQDYTNKVVETAVSQSHVDLEVNSIVEAKASSMYQETKDLLEMQFAKIQHETESLQIWCGLLTVVFLIFSFYSLFKTDELVQQGRAGVKELTTLQKQGNESIEKLQEEGNKKIENFDKESKEAITQVKQKAVADRQEIEDSINQKKKDIFSQLDKKIEDANIFLDKKYDVLSKALNDLIKEKEYAQTIDSSDHLKIVISKIQELEVRIIELENHFMKDNHGDE